jgi:hypothetical protein
VRKDWVLVQSRVDVVARHPELLEAWRPIAREFDIFFGLEAVTDNGLASLNKDSTVERTVAGIAIAREYGYGVTGNFVIDPDWMEADFERLWAFVEKHRLTGAGFTILTPLPGTAYFDTIRDRIRALTWSQFDMHHLLWELRDMAPLGPEPEGQQEVVALGRAGEAAPLGASGESATADAADDARAALRPRPSTRAGGDARDARQRIMNV